MNEDKLKSLIIDTIKSFRKKRIRRRELFGNIGIKGLEYEDFKRILTGMEKAGEIFRLKGRRFALPEKSEMVTGIFSALRNGGGFIRTPDGESVYVRQPHVESALSGDKVQAKIYKKRHHGLSHEANIVSIIERRTKPVVGIFRKRKKTAYIIPREDGFTHNLLVKEGGECGAEDGEMVVARIESESTGFSQPLCSITEVLGDPDSPGVDVLAVAFKHDLPIIFPDEVTAESEQLEGELSPDILEKRMDIRGTVTFTIDPFDARDFDDAISITRTDDGGYELGVHIADVSHYVPGNSAMDREAVKRGMSCYLTGRVIPMLPERLSNELCSLKPDEDRLTKSVFIRLNGEGNVLSHYIAGTVIHSSKRLTYEQVQAFIDGRHEDGAEEIPADVGEALYRLSGLTGKLIERRAKRGGLDFELPETQVMLDEDGRPVDIVKRTRLMAHRMVEEAMLLANTITAEKLKDVHAPFLYRIHDRPDDAKLETFGETAAALGYKFRASHAADEGYIQSFIQSISGAKHEHLLNMLLLRSMKKAAYSSRNIGHYGLGISTYSHFTSPIRRYPDLVMHRQLDAFVLNDGKAAGRENDTFYENLGEAITGREIVTAAAERESIKMKTAEYMQDHLGEEHEGTISGMIPVGFFVELDRHFVEGLVHVSTLDDDYYEVDRTGISMTGKNRGKCFMLGDRVRVIVARADKERGEVDFVLVKRAKKRKKKK